jgi:hypothetical protein
VTRPLSSDPVLSLSFHGLLTFLGCFRRFRSLNVPLHLSLFVSYLPQKCLQPPKQRLRRARCSCKPALIPIGHPPITDVKSATRKNFLFVRRMLPPKSSTHVTVKSRLAQSARTNSVDHALNYILPIYLSILLPTVDEQQELNCDRQVYMGVRICVELQTSSERGLLYTDTAPGRYAPQPAKQLIGPVWELCNSASVSLEALVKKVRCL